MSVILTDTNRRLWDFPIRVACGQIPDVFAETKFGENKEVGTSFEDVWRAGGVLSYLSSAETMDVVSTSGDDDGAPQGSGAWTVQLEGVDDNYHAIFDVVTLNGTSAVTTTKSFLRVNRAFALTGNENVGTITITASTAGTTQAQIAIGESQTLKTQYTVPDKYYALITGGRFSTLRSDQSEIKLEVRPFGGVFRITQKIHLYEVFGSTVINPPKIVSPKSDIRLQAINKQAGLIEISASYDFYLVKEKFVTERGLPT